MLILKPTYIAVDACMMPRMPSGQASIVMEQQQQNSRCCVPGQAGYVHAPHNDTLQVCWKQ